MVQFGFSARELGAMDFAELGYWMDAIAEFGRATEGGGGEPGSQ